MESSYTRGGEKADLVSPWIPAKSGGQCLKFYYTMYGKTTGSLAEAGIIKRQQLVYFLQKREPRQRVEERDWKH